MYVLTIALLAAIAAPVAQGSPANTHSSTLDSTFGPAVSEAASQTSPSPSLPEAPSRVLTREVLTLDQALALAEKNSPLLSEASAQVSRAKAGIRSASAYTNPTFEVQAGRQGARPITMPGVPGALEHFSATQTFEIPAERRARIRASRLELSSTEYFAAGTHLSVVAEVKHAFYDVLRRKEEVDLTKENLALVDDLRRRVAVRVRVGEAGRLELTRSEAETARARARVSSAEIELARSQALLRSVIGAPPGANYDPQGTLEAKVQLAPLSQLRSRVLARHPAVAEAKAQTARAEALVADQKALRIPQPNFYGEYEIQPDITFYRFGVTIPLPIWDRRKGPIGEAEAQVKRSQAATRRSELEITAALERAYEQYQLSDQQVDSLQHGSLREAEAAVEAARAAYKFGERGILEVLDAQRVLQGVRDDLLDAVYGRQSALVDLEELGAAP